MVSDKDAHRKRMRLEGYRDGVASRPAAHLDAEYQVAWRRGREARDEINEREGKTA